MYAYDSIAASYGSVRYRSYSLVLRQCLRHGDGLYEVVTVKVDVMWSRAPSQREWSCAADRSEALWPTREHMMPTGASPTIVTLLEEPGSEFEECGGFWASADHGR